MKKILFILCVLLTYIIFVLALTCKSFYEVKYREEGFTLYKDTMFIKE